MWCRWAGETVLELLLLMPDQELFVLGLQNVREFIAITTWYLWWDRRKLVHEGKSQDAHQTSMGARAITANYVNAHSLKATSKTRGWSRPPMGFVKLNVDAAFYPDEGRGATAAVIRDGKGNFLAAHCIYLDYAADAMMAEAMAMRDGLIFANSLGFPWVEAESDSSLVVEYCT